MMQYYENNLLSKHDFKIHCLYSIDQFSLSRYLGMIPILHKNPLVRHAILEHYQGGWFNNKILTLSQKDTRLIEETRKFNIKKFETGLSYLVTGKRVG